VTLNKKLSINQNLLINLKFKSDFNNTITFEMTQLRRTRVLIARVSHILNDTKEIQGQFDLRVYLMVVYMRKSLYLVEGSALYIYKV
jgi:hypothetical protein